jgi:hypothetical protein
MEDLTGKIFGRWTAISIAASKEKDGRVRWVCKCQCGTIKEISGNSLRTKNSRSCGCLRTEELVKRVRTHGQSVRGNRTAEYNMWKSAKHRAAVKGLDFNLELSDIVVPEFCPVFTSVRLNKTHTKSHYDSPSLDRRKPELGYVKGNVQVISHKANTIKQNATPEEIRRVADWLEGELHAR